ncbi:phage neck terminator protein [Paenibacillus pini]|uniref:Phage neck terminator protein gp12-like domain-containing protein n=1 Tax=Paenibacillus pini JCM 16418 TaxID=1236976 RepID=W7YE99_9BACL|nr:hypothetical protein [Paenibacillus pini]GAF06817.1 hypothetical protein JCM16418_799 [Paenibacillus pini JCM 16418]
MVNFELIRATLVGGLSAYIGMPVIESDTAANMPSYPYMTYNFITNGISSGLPGMTISDGPDDEVIEQYSDEQSMMVSFSSYALRKADSIQNAMRAAEWLNIIGYDELKTKANLIVVDVGDIHNRDVQIGDEWERRNGFDAELRTVNALEMKQDRIKKANLQRG